MKKIVLVTLLSLCTSSFCNIASLLQSSQSTLSTSSIDKQLAILEKERSELSKPQQQTAERAARAAELKSLRSKLETVTGSEHEFINKKMSLVTQDYQVVSEIEQADQNYRTLLDDHIKLLQEYKSDPEFLKLKIPTKTSYNFEDFEDIGHRLLSIKTRLGNLEKSRAGAYEDVNKRKRARSMIEEEYQEKVRQPYEEAVKSESLEALSHAQQSELIDLQQRLLEHKKKLADIKVKEADQRVNFFDTESMMVRAQLSKLKEYYDEIKRTLYVDAHYVRKAEEDLERKRNESAATREQLNAEIKSINGLKAEMHKKIMEAAEKLSIADPYLVFGQAWNKIPKTIQEWTNLCTLGFHTLEESVIDLEREYKEAKIELEKARLGQEEVHTAIIRSWHAFTTRRLGFSSHALEQQSKSYETIKTEIQADLVLLAEKRAHALTLLQELNTLLDRIKKIYASLKGRKAEFKDSTNHYDNCMQRMHEAEEQVRRRMYLTAKLIEVYSTAIATREETIKRIENVILELKTKSFWRRSSLSLTHSDLRNFFPDIKRFAEDIKTSFAIFWDKAIFDSFFQRLSTYNKPSMILLILLRIFIALLLFWLIRTYLPDVRDFLAYKPGYFGRSRLKRFGAFVLDFIMMHLKSLYIWLLLYLLIHYEIISNVHFSLLFYLASIPYMLFIAHRFISEFSKENERLNQLFVRDAYKARFFLVIPPLLYSTIILFFFRNAFMVGNYHGSAVPSVLLALNYIVLQLALMSLISKEWILSLIPRTTPLWEWVYDHVNRYYYLIWFVLITIIIMSNPYVGYGRQVLYVLSRLVIIGILIPLLSYIYGRIRRVSADLFFYYSEGDTVVERFNSARTWYGFLVIAIFCAFILLGLILVANVLNYNLNFHDVIEWLRYELYSHADELGRRLVVTPVSFLKIVLFFVAGLLAAYIINNILLKRIFDPLLVSAGIQNTVFTFIRYATIFIALLVGFKSVGLQSFAMQFVLVLGALGFAVKDPLLDFFSYFIILVQRPIKIGDLIMLDDNATGIVRHITPRSVILRRKNSVTVIVPNSHIITRPVVNWTYSPTFFALNDMMITVPYTADPEQVRSIMTQVLDTNSNVLKSPAPLVLLFDFVDHGFQFLIRAYVTADKVLEQWEISSAVRLEIVKALRRANIAIAVPTRVLKVYQESTKGG